MKTGDPLSKYRYLDTLAASLYRRSYSHSSAFLKVPMSLMFNDLMNSEANVLKIHCITAADLKDSI